MTEEMQKVAAEACHCVRCGDCNGSGNIWFDFRGRYLGRGHCDDMDEIETCEQCGGRGIVESCSRCQLLDEMDDTYDGH